MPGETKTYPESVADYIRRVVTYTDEVSYFGENSAQLALAKADAGLAEQANSLHLALLRRYTLLGSADEDLVAAAAEYGARQRGATRSRALVVMRPFVVGVTAVTAGNIEVDDSTPFTAGDSIRIRAADGTPTEIATIGSITTATGPNGGDELNVGSLVNTYDPTTEDVSVLLRETVTEGTVIETQAGINFETLEDVTIGDLNPVLDGESEALSLNDKVWCEASTRGVAGNVDASTVTGFQTPNPDVKDLFNPERAFGGNDLETGFGLKRRAAHRRQIEAQETGGYFEALAKVGDRQVLRTYIGESTSISTIQIIVVTRNGGGLSSDARDALSLFIQQRMRSAGLVEIVNATMTAVEVEATITLDPGDGTAAQRLRTVHRQAADRLAAFLDYRKWAPGENVDEADLLSIVNLTPGVASVVTSTFVPASDVVVSETSAPIFTRLQLTDETSGEVLGADLTPEF